MLFFDIVISKLCHTNDSYKLYQNPHWRVLLTPTTTTTKNIPVKNNRPVFLIYLQFQTYIHT